MATPAWIGATSKQPLLANQVNQFLGTHAVTYLYTGVSIGSTTLGSGTVATNGLYIAQEFTPGANQTPGRFVLTLSVTGTPAPLTLSVQTDNSGAPSGTALVTTLVPYTYLTGAATATSVPLPCSLTGATNYWLVANAVGDVSDFYSFTKSTAASGASTSPTGSVWTAQAYGLTYVRYDQSPVPPLAHTWGDSGVRWTAPVFNANATPASLAEYTVAQGTNQFVYSARAYAYTNGQVTSVS
jgi:hypothetical protein